MAREGAVAMGVAVLRRGLEEEDMEALQGGARARGQKKYGGKNHPEGKMCILRPYLKAIRGDVILGPTR